MWRARPAATLASQGGEEMGIGAQHSGAPVEHRPRITFLPTTRLGWWAVGLSAGFWAFAAAATVVPRGAGIAFLLGLAGAVAGLTAIWRDGDRGAILLAAFLPAVIAVAFVLAELIGSA
jgi:hypothetical protein